MKLVGRRAWPLSLLAGGLLLFGYLLVVPSLIRMRVVCKDGAAEIVGAAHLWDTDAGITVESVSEPVTASSAVKKRDEKGGSGVGFGGFGGDGGDGGGGDDQLILVSKKTLHELLALNSSKAEGVKTPEVSGNPTITLELPVIYVITPTYRRPEQIPELTRLSQTLSLVPSIFWIIVEDAKERTPLVSDLLQRAGIPYVHMLGPMPEKYMKKLGAKPRGVSNRIKGLDWIRKNAKDGVVYFADDDNTYDIRIFEEMRYTKKVSMWPVGLLTSYGLSTPIVKKGKLAGFYDGWLAGRKFPVDMAGFAVSVRYLQMHPNASMPYSPGYEEDGYLNSLKIKKEDIELKADNCTKLLVWHTQTKRNNPAVKINLKKYNGTNLELLTTQVIQKS